MLCMFSNLYCIWKVMERYINCSGLVWLENNRDIYIQRYTYVYLDNLNGSCHNKHLYKLVIEKVPLYVHNDHWKLSVFIKYIRRPFLCCTHIYQKYLCVFYWCKISIKSKLNILMVAQRSATPSMLEDAVKTILSLHTDRRGAQQNITPSFTYTGPGLRCFMWSFGPAIDHYFFPMTNINNRLAEVLPGCN